MGGSPTCLKKAIKQIEFGKIRILFAEYGRIALLNLVSGYGAGIDVPHRYLISICLPIDRKT